MILLQSAVKGNEGLCTPTWLNSGRIFQIQAGGRTTGFFKNVRKNWHGAYVKTGKEFHGYIKGKRVLTTEGLKI